jgi:hypothetical protein
MQNLIKILTAVIETASRVPVLVLRGLTELIAFNPRLGPLRYVFLVAVA